MFGFKVVRLFFYNNTFIDHFGDDMTQMGHSRQVNKKVNKIKKDSDSKS